MIIFTDITRSLVVPGCLSLHLSPTQIFAEHRERGWQQMHWVVSGSYIGAETRCNSRQRFQSLSLQEVLSRTEPEGGQLPDICFRGKYMRSINLHTNFIQNLLNKCNWMCCIQTAKIHKKFILHENCITNLFLITVMTHREAEQPLHQCLRLGRWNVSLRQGWQESCWILPHPTSCIS